MSRTEFKKQEEKYFHLLKIAADLLDDGVDPDEIIDYLNSKKGELSAAYPFYFLFCGFLSANLN